MSYDRPDRAALAFQREDRERLTTLSLLQRIDALERRVEHLERGGPTSYAGTAHD